MNIAFFELQQEMHDTIKEHYKQHNVLLFEEAFSDEHISKLQDVEVISVFVYSFLTKERLEQLPRLKMVTTMSTGFDHIDIDACKERDIKVCNVPSYGENTVAEHTMALILALSRKLWPSIKRTNQEHAFITDDTLRGFDLQGKTIGIVGCGNIGQHVARMAKGFGMHVITFDMHPNAFVAETVGFDYVHMDELYAASDIITLHVPYNTHTHHLLNEETFGKMKDGVHIINTARGGLIDTHALVKALQSGKVGAAALDVLEDEGSIKEEMAVLATEHKERVDLQAILEGHLLMRMDNVIITPHNAFNSNEALMRIVHTSMANIDQFIAGNALDNAV